MDRQSWLELLMHHRAIAVIRAPTLEQGERMAQAMAEAGFHLLEITWNSADAEKLIATLTETLPDAVIGTGTVLNAEMLDRAIATGARFIFTPHTDPHLIQRAMDQHVPLIPGALTPTEMTLAWQAGAAAVKVFPVGALGGAQYIQSLQGPLGHIPLIPTGGVTLDNAKAFLDAGAIAVGLSSHLFPRPLVAAQNWSLITRRASGLLCQIAASA